MKNTKKTLHRGWRRIQFDAPPELVTVVDKVKKLQHITASAFVRSGFTTFLVEHGLLKRPQMGVGLDFHHQQPKDAK